MGVIKSIYIRCPPLHFSSVFSDLFLGMSSQGSSMSIESCDEYRASLNSHSGPPGLTVVDSDCGRLYEFPQLMDFIKVLEAQAEMLADDYENRDPVFTIEDLKLLQQRCQYLQDSAGFLTNMFEPNNKHYAYISQDEEYGRDNGVWIFKQKGAKSIFTDCDQSSYLLLNDCSQVFIDREYCPSIIGLVFEGLDKTDFVRYNAIYEL